MKVLTGADVDGVLAGVPTRAMEGVEALDEINIPEQPVLAVDKVCYVGQPVAIVVAEERYVARDGGELINVEYEPLTPVLDPFKASKEGATPRHSHLGTNVGIRIHHEGGDLEAAFSQADRVIEQRYEVQRLAPAPLEARAVLAHYQPEADQLTIWDSTQVPHQSRAHIAQLLNRPEDSVRLIAPDVGGGFGEKSSLFPEEISIPYLSLALKRPVKWIEDRQENMLAFHGRGHTVDVEAAVENDGSILGMRVVIVADLGAYFFYSTPGVPLLASHRIAGPYRTPSIKIDVVGAITNKPPTGAYRGAGGPESAFCMERTVDLIAKDLDLDPAEVRKRNFIPPEAFPYKTPTGITYDSGEYEKALDRALELSDYAGWRERARRRRTGEPLIGVGLSTVVKGAGGAGDTAVDVAQLKIAPAGEITVYTGVSPHGQGTETTFAQIVSAELGVSSSTVQVLHSDTAIYPAGGGTAASRGTVIGGSALYVVLQEARGTLSRLASRLLECPAERISFQDGRVFDSGDRESSVSFREVASRGYNEEFLAAGGGLGLAFSGTFALPSNTYSFGAHVAVVEVDRDTGEVKLLSYVAVHDCGRVINPMLVDGQMHGGIVQGVGQALTEGMVYSPDGQPLTGSLMDYALPNAEDMPNFVLDTMETPSPTSPLGAKGIGELPTVAAPAAVANAVLDALGASGVRHIDTPLTPEKIWRALRSSK